MNSNNKIANRIILVSKLGCWFYMLEYIFQRINKMLDLNLSYGALLDATAFFIITITILLIAFSTIGNVIFKITSSALVAIAFLNMFYYSGIIPSVQKYYELTAWIIISFCSLLVIYYTTLDKKVKRNNRL